MRLKDIKVGVEYAVTSWARLDRLEALLRGEADREGLRELSSYAKRAVVLETGVQVGQYKTRGVLVRHLDRDTGEPTERAGGWGTHEPDPTAPEALRAVQIVMPWQEMSDLYHHLLQEYEENERRKIEERKAAQNRRQEEAAREWMTRTFNQAADTIADMVELGLLEPTNGGDSDERVQRLVDKWHPNGNPFLNGERAAH